MFERKRFFSSAVAAVAFFVVVGSVTTDLVAEALSASPFPFTIRKILPPLERIPGAEEGSGVVAPEPLPVVYTNDLRSVRDWIDGHVIQKDENENGGPVLLGWDVESTPDLPWRTYGPDASFGPALLQLSTPDSALVLQLAQDGVGPIHRGGLPGIVEDLLVTLPSGGDNDDGDRRRPKKGVIPVGVGIDDDFVEMYRWCLEHGVDDCGGPSWAGPPGVLGRFDLGGIGSPRGGTFGLAKLTAGVLGQILPKTKTLSRTHWSKSNRLSDKELAYAARDAWAGSAVLDRLGRLDPDRFGPEAVEASLAAQAASAEDEGEGGGLLLLPLRPIRTVSNRRILRRAVRDEWKDLRRKDAVEDPWTDADRARDEELKADLDRLKPTPPVAYEVADSLGVRIG